MPEPTFDIPKFLYEHISYPLEAKNKNIQGKVFVQFIVDTLGNVSNIKVVKSPSKLLDIECIKAVNLFPKFKPGKQNGELVNVYYTVPITFKLEDAQILELYSDTATVRLFAFAQVLPEPTVNLEKYIHDNLHYPEMAIHVGFEGDVLLNVVIKKDGSVGPIKVLNSITPLMDDEAISVIKNIPNWKPAVINNQPTDVYFPLTVEFKITDNMKIKDSIKLAISPKEKIDSSSFYVESMPEAGYNINQYLASNIYYPDAAKDANIQGMIIVRFMIDTLGRLNYIQIPKNTDSSKIRGITKSPILEETAINVVKRMPIWKKPGSQKGKKVNVWFTMPINFRLE